MARITPHPGSQPLIKAVRDLRKNPWFPDASVASVATEPTGGALWCRDVYGTRFAVTAPFPAADGVDRWYLWDLDACSGTAYTVGSGYYADPEQAFSAWCSAVGHDAAAASRLAPVSDAGLADRLLPMAEERRAGGESQAQYAELFRSRRLAQDLRIVLRRETTREDWSGRDAVTDAWIAEFAAWRAGHRPGQSMVPDGFPVDEEPLDDDEVYRELASSWVSDELPDLAYLCSPHMVAVNANSVRLLFDEDFAQVLLRQFPDVVSWLAARAGLPEAAADRVRGHAARMADPETDFDAFYTAPMERIQE